MVKIKLEISNISSIRDSDEEQDLKSQEIEMVKKSKSKIKLRSLVKTESTLDNDKSDDCKIDETPQNTKFKWKYVVLAVLVLISSLCFSKLTISSCGFWATYENNFNKIVYGDERWCYRKLESSVIIEKLKEQVIGQDDAIKLIGASLNLANREKIIQLALFGDVGVGKTFTSNIIMEHWKWKPVISLIFDINFQMHLAGQEATDNDLKVVTTRLSDCGFNLVVIDDLKAEAVERMKKLERNLHRIAKQNMFKIVLIVIFNESSNSTTIQDQLENFVTIEYQSFTEELFQKCIEVHEKLRKIQLKPKEIDELREINFTNSGCKTVAKKLNLMSKN